MPLPVGAGAGAGTGSLVQWAGLAKGAGRCVARFGGGVSDMVAKWAWAARFASVVGARRAGWAEFALAGQVL